MAAVIRVKRRLEEEPSNALILNCKKRKTDKVEATELSALLKFAGTLKNQEDDIFTHIKKVNSKQELEEQFKKHNNDLTTKLRDKKLKEAKASRYKIVNCFRSKGGTSLEDSSRGYTVYDVETDAENDKGANSYVYDLYYTASDDLGDGYLEDYVSMYRCNGDLVFGSFRDNGAKEADSEDDSEDSNAENNWRNDYPDESDIESIEEDDMIKAMTRCDLDDLSSDDGEEGFIYSVDSEAAGFEEGIDDSDVQRYGERYARFKARNKKGVESSGVNNELYYGDIDEEECYY